jgi:hypothetical protein
VYLEWLSMYRARGPVELRPVGEVEFVNGVAAIAASGTDGPFDRDSCRYHVLWNAFKRIAAGCSAAEKAALFAGTATTFYRLG